MKVQVHVSPNYGIEDYLLSLKKYLLHYIKKVIKKINIISKKGKYIKYLSPIFNLNKIFI